MERRGIHGACGRGAAHATLLESMRQAIFTLKHPRRLWIPLLPLTLASAGLTAAAILRPWLAPWHTALLACVTAAFAALEGALLSRDSPGLRSMEARAAQLQAVTEVLRKAGSTLDLQEVLDAITRLTVEVTGVRGCSIKLLDEVGGPPPAAGAAPGAEGHSRAGSRRKTMRVRSLAGIRREVSDLAAETAESIYARSLLEGQPVRVEGALESDFPELDGEVESLICVPLRHEGKVVGALCLYGEKGKSLPGEMLSFLSRLGDLVTLSIQKASVYESLKKIDEAKTWFLLKASHELKSPLAGIQSICQTILEGYLGDVAPRQRELIERIRFRSALLLETANDLLVLAKARSQTLAESQEPIEPCQVLEEAVRFFQPAAAEKGIGLEISKPCQPSFVSASREGLRSVMSNLISNAIKYSPTGTTVSVSLETVDSGMRFTVRDAGIGIPEAERKGLFREFFRASNARSMTEAGTGLGLSIVKSVVDSLGGSIELESEEGRGTTVIVSLAGGG